MNRSVNGRWRRRTGMGGHGVVKSGSGTRVGELMSLSFALSTAPAARSLSLSADSANLLRTKRHDLLPV